MKDIAALFIILLPLIAKGAIEDFLPVQGGVEEYIEWGISWSIVVALFGSATLFVKVGFQYYLRTPHNELVRIATAKKTIIYCCSLLMLIVLLWTIMNMVINFYSQEELRTNDEGSMVPRSTL